MIPATRDISVTSTLEPKETIKLAVDQNNSRQLMAMLSAIYSDEEAAIVREYITNALDSHIEAGQTRPIEVTSPGRLSPFFVVQDFGVGLSMDDLRNVYALYGASTKRETQDQAGSLGIGAKSALAYAGQFTVTSIKDGEKVVAIISLDEDEAGVMDILSVTKTNDHNGVTISIPVNTNHNSFNGKLHKMHAILEPGLMNVDGVDATREHITVINEKFAMYGDAYTGDMVVMGNVAYPLDRNVYGRIHRSFSVIVRVEMGEVLFTPSREELNYTPKTRETLDRYKREFNENIIGYMQKMIDEKPNKREAFNAQYDFMRRLDYTQRNVTFTYKGKALPTTTDVGLGGTHVTWGLHGRSYCRTYGYSQFNKIDEDMVYITNFNNAKFTKIQGLKINKFLDDKGIKHSKEMYILKTGFDYQGLFDDITVYDYEADIKPIKVVNNVAGGTGRGRGKVRQYLVTGGGEGHGMAIPNATVNLWYASKSELGSGAYVNWERKTAEFNLDTDQLVFVTDTELKAFLKNYPTAKHYRGFYVAELDRQFATLTQDHYDAVKYSGGIANSGALIANEILDPVLKAYVTADRNDQWSLRSQVEGVRRLAYKVPPSVRDTYLAKLPVRDDQTSDDTMKRYPVLSEVRFYGSVSHESKRLFTDYVNAVYTELNQQKEAADASI